jgi:hypothetical protein
MSADPIKRESKKRKKNRKGKPKLLDLMKVMDSFQMAHSVLKCELRSLRHRCDPSGDREDAMPDLYDEIVLFTKATEMFHDTYQELDHAEMAIYRIREKR